MLNNPSLALTFESGSGSSSIKLHQIEKVRFDSETCSVVIFSKLNSRVIELTNMNREDFHAMLVMFEAYGINAG